MSSRKLFIGIIGIAALVVLAFVFIGNDVTTTTDVGVSLKPDKVKGEAPLDPKDKRWNEVKAKEVAMTPIGEASGEINKIQVKVLASEDRIFFRLEWADKTKNDLVTNAREFSDAAAIQIAKDKNAAISMGTLDNNVNIWYWKAFYNGSTSSSIVENLIAGGPGTLTSLDENNLQYKELWENDTWSVVISGPAENNEEFQAAFAVWDGAQMERNGMKSVSSWIQLSLN